MHLVYVFASQPQNFFFIGVPNSYTQGRRFHGVQHKFQECSLG